MVPFEKQRRFRINPVEVAIFVIISLIFVKSGYSLLYARPGFEPEVLTASAQNPLEDPLTPDSSRGPASVGSNETPAKTFSDVTIDCGVAAQAPTTRANKIRLIGDVCGGATVGAPDEAARDVKGIHVVNTSAKVTATVFPDYSNLKFSTDYISLNEGKNLISVEYEFKDGKILGREFSVTKN